MALNWNIQDCKNYKQLGTEKNWRVTNSLIWATMAVGLWHITDKNYDEFYRRLHILEQKNGTFLMRDRQPYFITKADVKRRIGLRTNASTISKRDFNRKHAH
jgi:hypothetical protein